MDLTQEEKQVILDPNNVLQTQNRWAGIFLVATALIVGFLLVMQTRGTSTHHAVVSMAAPAQTPMPMTTQTIQIASPIRPQPIDPDVLANDQNLMVTNKDRFAYHNVEITLNRGEDGAGEGYVLYPGTIKPGETQTYSLSDFVNSNGTHFDSSSMKVRTPQLTCDTPQGSKMGFWSGDLSDHSE